MGQVDPAAVVPFAGPYTNPALGEARLALRGGRLIFEAGELLSELRPVRNEAGGAETFIFTDPPLARPLPLSVALRQGTDGCPEMVLTIPDETPSTSDSDDAPGLTPGMTYVYKCAGAGAAATPPR